MNKVYKYDKHSGKYLGEVDLPNGITLANSLATAPPTSEHIYSGGEWVLFPTTTPKAADVKVKTLHDAREAKKLQLKQDFLSSLSSGFTCTVNSIKMDADLKSITKFKSGYDLALLQAATVMDVRDFDNVTHSAIPMADALAMIIELGNNYQAKWSHKNTLLATLKNKLTVKTINAV